MLLKPQDILVVLKLVAMGQKPWSYAGLARELGISPSQLHAAIKRTVAARLAIQQDERIVADVPNLAEFLLHGLQYVLVPEWGGVTRGMPTSYAAPPLQGAAAAPPDPVPVWPDPQGGVRGVAFTPLYKSVPQAARADPKLYELLALVDAIRGGVGHEREAAGRMLEERLYQRRDAKEIDMGASDAIQIGAQLSVPRAELESLVKRFRIRRLAVFGSAARGELRADSDVDLMVEFEAGQAPSLWSATELQEAFSRLFGGRPVDIVPPEVLRNPYRRKTIERDLKVLVDEAA